MLPVTALKSTRVDLDTLSVAANGASVFFAQYAKRLLFALSAIAAGLIVIVALLATIPKLTVTPSVSAKFSGAPGGPFAPDTATYSIRNRGLAVKWWLKGVPSWIETGERQGTILLQGGQSIRFQPSAAARHMSPGVYMANIQVMASSLATISSIGLELEIKSTANKSTPLPIAAPVQLSELADLSCAHISIVQHDNFKILTGYVGSDTTLDRVRQIADDVPAAILGDVLIAMPPECDILKILERPLAAPNPPTINTGPSDSFREGDILKVEIHAPSTANFLQVLYLQADGTALRLFGPSAAPVAAGQVFTFGDGREGHRKFTVGPPFGQEMIVAIASAHPLFDLPYPDRQSASDFLTALSSALAASASDVSRGDVRAAAKTLTTRRR
jgi:hypothetical protein